MKDSYERTIDYMRISITGRCNMRCKYCMPDKIWHVPMEEILTYEEIVKICKEGAGIGIRHLKVTGGEPLVRKGCVPFIRQLKQIPDIDSVTLTTNGIELEQYLKELKEIGIDGINISLDTLDKKEFQEITGRDGLKVVLNAIEASVVSGIRTKINCVSLGGKDEEHWVRMAELAAAYPIDVRFIEMMPIGQGKNFSVVSQEQVANAILHKYASMEPTKEKRGYGPAVYYKIPGFLGRIGFISAIHGKFCNSCNRIRLTSEGYLKTCLCFEDGVSLRQILRDGKGNLEERLKQAIKNSIKEKPAAHCFNDIKAMTEQNSMGCIGG